MSKETPISDDIISDLHNDLESSNQEICTCGSNPERSCKHCDRWTRAMNRACSAIGEMEIENIMLRARVAALEKDKERYHWLCQHLSSDWMIEEDEVSDFIDMDQWEKEGGNDDAPEVQKAWNLIIDQHKAQQ